MQMIESFLTYYQIPPLKRDNIYIFNYMATSSGLHCCTVKSLMFTIEETAFTTFPSCLCSKFPPMGMWVEVLGADCPRQLKCLRVFHIPSMLSMWLEEKPSTKIKFQSESSSDPWVTGGAEALSWPAWLVSFYVRSRTELSCN